MAQLIVEAGADALDPLVLAAEALLGGESFRIEALPAPDTRDLLYRDFPGGLADLGALLREGAVTSARIAPGDGRWWMMLFRPMFDSDGAPWWSLVVEYRILAADRAFEELKRIPGVSFVSVSMEESLDFGPGPVTPGTFPWTHFRLIRAAVRDGAGGWVERRGPAEMPRDAE